VAAKLVVEKDEYGVGELEAFVGQVAVPGLVADGALPGAVVCLAGQRTLGLLQGGQEFLPVVQPYVSPPTNVEIRPDVLHTVCATLLPICRR